MKGFIKTIIILALVVAAILGSLIVLHVGTVSANTVALERIIGVLIILAVLGIISLFVERA